MNDEDKKTMNVKDKKLLLKIKKNIPNYKELSELKLFEDED